MDSREEQLQLLRQFNSEVRESDPELGEESLDFAIRPESTQTGDPIEDGLVEESIALRSTRPVLPIRDNETRLVFVERADSKIWTDRLTRAKPVLTPAICAVGRVNLKGAPLGWVGTGWIIAENIVVTNRHVAREFAMRDGESFTFQTEAGGPVAADVDFLQEIDNPTKLVFRLIRPLYIQDRPGPDVAFFQIEPISGDATLAAPLPLAAKARKTASAAVIGYPAYDSRIPERALMERVFRSTYDKKRLAPGAVTAVEEYRILHNCTTLGGNSGSALVDLETGEALGLHFSGTFLTANYAVPANIVRTILDDVRSGRAPRRERSTQSPAAAVPPPRRAPAPLANGGGAIITIALTVTVSVGEPRAAAATVRRTRMLLPPSRRDETEPVEETEAVAADYRNRLGYQPQFLGPSEEFAVALPTVRRRAGDVLNFEFEGRTESELRYQHFSVVMNQPRRMCFFSAVNIDGKLARKSSRVGWKWDPRIPKHQQIMHECYGSPPKFSRGHMTRREDPSWGRDEDTARRGNEDSMHVTNTTPQMQAFNAPIWLALEDYALDHAKKDEMRISVFTGPYLHDDDPEMHGVQIPRTFWKIIAFVHDRTGKLCATGYEMNQEQNLQPEEEFIYGPFTSPQLNIATQVSILRIERRSGLSFGTLASLDPRAGEEEGVGDGEPAVPLLSFEQIRFV